MLKFFNTFFLKLYNYFIKIFREKNKRKQKKNIRKVYKRRFTLFRLPKVTGTKISIFWGSLYKIFNMENSWMCSHFQL